MKKRIIDYINELEENVEALKYGVHTCDLRENFSDSVRAETLESVITDLRKIVEIGGDVGE